MHNLPKSTLIFCLMFGSSLLLSSGCSTNTTGIVSNSSGTTQVNNASLGKHLRFEQVKGDYINSLYQARVILSNTKNSTQNYQYFFSWFDTNGTPIEADSTAWMPIVIHGKTQRSITALAPTPGATQFTVNVRELKSNKTFKTNFLGIE